jgi:hypothetical protein
MVINFVTWPRVALLLGRKYCPGHGSPIPPQGYPVTIPAVYTASTYGKKVLPTGTSTNVAVVGVGNG